MNDVDFTYSKADVTTTKITRQTAQRDELNTLKDSIRVHLGFHQP
jgi:hypothetical protein